MIVNFIGVLFDGIAYGSLLFLISIGLSVTMGLMNFVNLAHGAFAMIGGYVCVTVMSRIGVPFLATLPVAFFVTAGVGAILERTLYQQLYQAKSEGRNRACLEQPAVSFVSPEEKGLLFGTSQFQDFA